MNDPLIVMLLDASIRSTAAVALSALVLIALRVRSSALRHAAWTMSVVAMLLMPLLVTIVPVVAVPAPDFAAALVPPLESTSSRPLGVETEAAATSPEFSISSSRVAATMVAPGGIAETSKRRRPRLAFWRAPAVLPPVLFK